MKFIFLILSLFVLVSCSSTKVSNDTLEEVYCVDKYMGLETSWASIMMCESMSTVFDLCWKDSNNYPEDEVDALRVEYVLQKTLFEGESRHHDMAEYPEHLQRMVSLEEALARQQEIGTVDCPKK